MTVLPPARRPVGIRQLADHLGISIGTVSRALNGRTDVNPQTRERVLAAAQALGYSPNQSGRSLRQGMTRAIGFMWQIADAREDFGEPFFVALFDAVQAELNEHHLDLMIFLNQASDDPVGRVRRVVERGMVDALILPWTLIQDPRLDFVASRHFPFVALGRSLSGGEHDWMDLDFEPAAYEATRRLIERGHRHVAVGIPGAGLMQGEFFMRGYRRAIAEAGIAFDESLTGSEDMSEAGGYRLTSRLMARTPRPTALTLVSSTMVVGAYRRLGELGLKPGRDVAIFGGVMDTPVFTLLQPAVSCFTLSVTDLGKRLARVLLSVLSRPPEQQGHIQELWPLTLVNRQSDLPQG